MADPLTTGLSEAGKILQAIEEVGILAQLGVSLGLTLFALLFDTCPQNGMELVKRTEAEWDNDILDPLMNRVYVFVLLAGVELTMMWTLGRNDAIYSAVAPYFSAAYIVLSASIISVAIKFIVPGNGEVQHEQECDSHWGTHWLCFPQGV